jgi:hypothetical protein
MARSAGDKTAGQWVPAFIDNLRVLGNVSMACDVAGAGRSTVYERRGTDPEFAKRWDDAFAFSRATVDSVARQIALDPTASNADRLKATEMWMRTHDPDWKEARQNSKQQIEGTDGGPVRVTFKIASPQDEDAVLPDFADELDP